MKRLRLTLLLWYSIIIVGCAFIQEPDAPVYQTDGEIKNVYSLTYSGIRSENISLLQNESELAVITIGSSEDTAYFSVESNMISPLSGKPSPNHFTQIHSDPISVDSASTVHYPEHIYTSDSLTLVAGCNGAYDYSGYGANAFTASFEVRSLGKDTLIQIGDSRDYSTFTTIVVKDSLAIFAGATSDVNGGYLSGYTHSPSYIRFSVFNLNTFSNVERLYSFTNNDAYRFQVTDLIVHENLAVVLGRSNSSGHVSSKIMSFTF